MANKTETLDKVKVHGQRLKLEQRDTYDRTTRKHLTGQYEPPQKRR